MRKLVLLAVAGLLLIAGLFYALPSATVFKKFETEENEREEDEYENLQDRYTQLFEQLKDPGTNSVPSSRLVKANRYTRQLQQITAATRTSIPSLVWEERGPYYDQAGPSNNNKRGTTNAASTAGVVQSIFVDLANDPTGNIAFAGSPAGGLWKCINLASTSEPNWTPVNDFQANLAIASITQNPSRPSEMYIATGDANTRDVLGYGVWKSTDAGQTWSVLPSTISFNLAFKIICDASGTLYLATGKSGLQRSTDGGATWQRITARTITSGTTALSNPSYITDIELSSTGRLHAAIGYYGTACQHYYTDSPATVDSTSWRASTGIASLTACSRIELACQGNVLYSVLGNTSNNIDYCYKSVDGGATWTKQNTSAYTTSLGSSQSWYAVTLQIDPDNSNTFIVGGLDAYKSTNSGSTITKITSWVSSDPYVHADHHTMSWYKVGSESRIVVGCDGGVFISADAGVSWRDRNKNLRIKTFYSCATTPTPGSIYILAGAQDNGVHQLKQPGLGWSTEVTGGDGANVYISQANPNIQFGSYVYNDYRRSTDGGATWSSMTLSNSTGYFINPFTYDDATNTLYASNASTSAENNQVRRWLSANTAASTSSTVITVSSLVRNGANNNASCFKMSPYTANRLFIGGNKGSIVRMDNASGTPTYTTLTSSAFPTGYINCINTGSSDNVMVATFTNYGVNNVWYTTDGGATWTPIDGNLPDMPVWWAVFVPGQDSRIILGTESGVWSTNAVNGASTEWTPSADFPVVRTKMLTVRPSDNLLIAATYGRGVYTATIPTVQTPDITFQYPSATGGEKGGTTTGCRTYKDYTFNMVIANAPTGDAEVTLNVQSATARQGVDFDITTNGSFTAPSGTLVFASGATAAKPFTVRVYDNAAVDGNRAFTLGYSISGFTDAVPGASNQTFTYTIADDDELPTAPYAITSTIGTSNSTGTTVGPFQGSNTKVRVQNLVTAAELSAAGVVPGKPITGIGINVITKGSTRAFTGLTVSMANNLATSFSNFIVAPFTTVYSGDYTTTTGWQTINFSTPFTWDGVSNILLNFCMDNAGAGGDDIVAINTAPFGTLRATTYAVSSTASVVGCTMSGQYLSTARPQFQLIQSVAQTAAETVLNASRTESLGGAADLYYYSATGKLMARIKNLSATGYGCTQVSIDRAGTGAATPFLVANPSNNLADKTFRVSTSGPTAGSWQVTLYVTREEKQGWEAATGRPWTSVQVVKLQDAISSVTPQAPPASGTMETVTPLLDSIGSIYTLTVTSGPGVKGYGIGVPCSDPVITVQPAPLSVCEGVGATMSVTALYGNSCQWRKDGVAIPGATGATYSIPSVAVADSGRYDVVVNNYCATVTSDAARLTVNTAPVIQVQPAPLTVCPGGNAAFAVSATGTGLTFQWRKNGEAITGATDSAYTINAVTAAEGGNYDVVITGTCGSLTSEAAALSLYEPVGITVQPLASQTLCEGANTTLTVTAAGAGLTYQWQKDGADIAGANTASYTINGATTGDAATYRVTLTGTCGTVVSDNAVVGVNPSTRITTQPLASQTVCSGEPVDFSVTASGTDLSYQWKKNGDPITGATSATYHIAGATAGDAATYAVDVSGACGAVTSSNAILAVNEPTLITAHPAPAIVCAGGATTFSVTATGTDLSYQWRKDGAPITGATGASYSIAAATATDAASYDVVVSGACGVLTSTAAALTVNTVTSITTQPAGGTVCAGSNTSFSVVATGTVLTWQWRKNGAAIPGATASTLTLQGVTPASAATYDVVVTGACGTVTSAAATLVVNTAPSISTQPAAQVACPGTTVSFTVSATGTSPAWQWRKNGVAITGATSATYTIASAAAGDAASYDVVVTNTCGSVTSAPATLVVNTATGITAQPVASQALCAGATASFSVAARGTGLTYQWQKGGTAINGATDASYSISNLGASDAATYTVVVRGACGILTSTPSVLSLNAPTTITTQPQAGTVCPGGTATLSVVASGTALNYQWRKAGVNIAGATAASLVITNAGAADAASYDVVVTGACGAVTSTPAALTLNAPTMITTQPQALSICETHTVSFSVAATGSGALSYQWRKDGVRLAGATAPGFTIARAALSDAGTYDVQVTAGCGTVTSAATPLTVNSCYKGLTVILEAGLLPNAVQDKAVLRVAASRSNTIQWQLFDAYGNLVNKFVQAVNMGINDLPLSLGYLPAGTYLLAGSADGEALKVIRFVRL